MLIVLWPDSDLWFPGVVLHFIHALKQDSKGRNQFLFVLRYLSLFPRFSRIFPGLLIKSQFLVLSKRIGFLFILIQNYCFILLWNSLYSWILEWMLLTPFFKNDIYYFIRWLNNFGYTLLNVDWLVYLVSKPFNQ